MRSRRLRLRKTLEGFSGPIFFSESFSDPVTLLAICEQYGLEGIVLKRTTIRSGDGDWIKVKTRAWREANKDRGELFGEVRE